jgi:peptide/nickel transport system ATP-binding protein
MYAGEIVETSPAATLRTNPQHPYTRGLMESFPPLTGPMQHLLGIPGTPPDLANPPAGCRFHPRCPLCVIDGPSYARQTTERPQLREIEPEHHVACHLAGGAA